MKRDATLAAAAAVLVLAATASLSRVFLTADWRPTTLVSIVVPIALASALRHLRFGIVASFVVSLVGYITYTYVVHLPPGGGLLPGTEQWHQFTELVSTGLRQVRDEPAPTLPLDGLVLLTTSGTWWLSWVVHELLVRARRPGLALFTAALLWTIPLAVPQPPSRTWPEALPFLGAAVLVLLLEADVDVVGWTRDRALPRLAPTGLALGAIAIVTATVAPGLLPGYRQEPWYDVGAGNDPRGYQPIVDVGDRLHLPDPRDVLEVRAPRPLYLRIAALDNFNGTTWRIGEGSSFRPDPASLTRGDQDLPPEVPMGPTQLVSAQVTVLDLENIYVPVPYQPVRITGGARDQMVYSREGGFVATVDLEERGGGGELVPGVVEGLEYGVVSALPAPTPEQVAGLQVDPDEVRTWLELPGDYGRFAELAESVYAQRGATTPLEKAYALQDFFIGPSSEYTYSTAVDSLLGATREGNPEALRRFLFEEKVGYCEYYAGAMAIMLRATGVPARVAVGFLPGRVVDEPTDGATADPTPDPDAVRTYRVSTNDAHAWVEVLQPGFGWLRFDPTPRSDGGTYPPTTEDLDPLQSLAERTQVDPGEVGPTDVPQTDLPPTLPPDDQPDAQPTSGAADEGGAGSGPNRTVLLAVAALLTIAGGAAVSSFRRRAHHPHRPDRERILAAQRRVHRAAGWYGIGRRPAETSLEVAQRWCREGRAEVATARRFTDLTQAAAFGGTVPDRGGVEAEELADRLVTALRDSVPLGERLTAPVRRPARRAAATGRDVWLRLRHGQPRD